MPTSTSDLRDFVYLDADRVRSVASQLDVPDVRSFDPSIQSEQERLFLQIEPALMARESVARIDAGFDFTRWTPDLLADGQFIVGRGTVRLLDFSWLTLAVGGLPAVLRKMNKIEMAALRNSEEGKRMSKTALQQRSQENQSAIAKVEEFKIEELGDVIGKMYGDIVRVKVRPSAEHPRALLVGSAYLDYFYDSPAALNQKYGIEIDAGWTVIGQVNAPGQAAAIQPMPIGNQMEDSFEQIALLMNNAFRLANAPAFPAFSITPLAIYRAAK
jgi:hypothetical protein